MIFFFLLCSCTDVDVPLQEQRDAYLFEFYDLMQRCNRTIIQSRSDIVHKTPACSLTLDKNHPVSSAWELNAHNFTFVCVFSANNWLQRQNTEDAILFWPLGGSRFHCFTVNVSRSAQWLLASRQMSKGPIFADLLYTLYFDSSS